MSLMICSTSHRQRGDRLFLLVAGAVLACFIVLLQSLFFFFFLHFMVYSVETVTDAFLIFLFYFFISFFPPCLLLFCGKL